MDEVAATDGLAVVVLAAGKGTRMRSRLHKMLHEVAGRPLLDHVLRAAEGLSPERIVVVVGHGAEEVVKHFRDRDATFVLQEPQRGTGHALMVTRSQLGDFEGDILVLNGDAPLLQASTLARLVDHHRSHGAGMTMLTYRVNDPTGLGRVRRASDGSVLGVVEERDLTETDRAICEIVPGFYLFDRQVFDLGDRLSDDNAQGELYITDLPGIYLAAGQRVEALLGHDDAGSRVGVNTRAELAEAEAIVRDRIRRRWLEAGVTMRSPATTFIDDLVLLAPDVILEPGVVLKGETNVGEGAVIGAYAYLDGVSIGRGERVAPHTVIRSTPASG